MSKTNTAMKKISALAVSAACVVSFGFAPAAYADGQTVIPGQSTDNGANQGSLDGSGQGSTGSADQGTAASAPQAGANTETSTGSSTTKIVMLKGGKQTLSFAESAGTVKASSNNKKVVKVTKTGKLKFKFKGLKTGKATVTFTSDKLSSAYKVKVVVASGNSFVNKWVKNLAKQITKSTSDTQQRLLMASEYIIANFSYANIFGDKKVISKQKGNCASAGRVLVKVYNAMGYKAKLRSAIHDKMSRYPSGISFGSDHYNVLVKAKGIAYYLDATPGMGFAYISNSKKPLAEYMYLGNGWMRIL